jgi:DDE superfamily endonuclease.
MSKSNTDIEKRISDALHAYYDRGEPKIAPLARESDVPYQRLRARVQGRPSRSAKIPSNKALDKGQEEALIAWVRVLDRANLSPLPYEIEDAANDILSRSCSDRRVSKSWVHRFMKRLPETFKFQTQKPIEAKRVDAEKLPTIIEWFHKLGGEIEALKVGPSNIYNVDETGFQLGQGQSQKIVTEFPDRTKHVPAGGIGETVTAIECIAADGWIMPPMILFAGTVHLENWYRDQIDLPDDYVIATSPTGWNNEVSA